MVFIPFEVILAIANTNLTFKAIENPHTQMKEIVPLIFTNTALLVLSAKLGWDIMKIFYKACCQKQA